MRIIIEPSNTDDGVNLRLENVPEANPFDDKKIKRKMLNQSKNLVKTIVEFYESKREEDVKQSTVQDTE